jgi:hypothetical protein
MTTSKCFKYLPNLAFTIAAVLASAGASAQTARNVTLQEGESVRIACPQGSSPILLSDIVQCARICNLEVVTQTAESCDQGGCFSTPSSFTVTLKSGKNESALFERNYSSANEINVVNQIKADFAGTCGIYQETDRTLPQ